MRAGILGGTRFIGWHLAEALLAAGHEVTLFHRGRTREPRPFSGAVRRVFGDRDRPESLAPFFARAYDVVYDLSAYTLAHVAPLPDLCRGRVGHLVFCSTASVYRVPPPPGFTEDAPRDTQAGTYGGEKALSEDRLLAAEGLPVTVLRPQGVFGPYHDQQMTYVARRLRAGAPVLVAPAFAGKRIAFLWVGDLVAVLLAAAGRREAFGQTYNLASEDGFTPEGLVAALSGVIGAPGETRALDARLSALLPDLGLSWLDHDLVADAGKAARLFGPLTPTREALRLYWEALRADPAALRFKPQRWEKAALEGRFPTALDRLSWRLYDAARLNPLARRVLG